MCRHGTHFLLLDPPSVPSRGLPGWRWDFQTKGAKAAGAGARGGPAGCGTEEQRTEVTAQSWRGTGSQRGDLPSPTPQELGLGGVGPEHTPGA